ncbi:hypothetical protein B194_2008 [Serratia plymuthica A30]|nr:hypothetical protein B194_2008 [Serratia plymuthica A30]
MNVFCKTTPGNKSSPIKKGGFRRHISANENKQLQDYQ